MKNLLWILVLSSALALCGCQTATHSVPQEPKRTSAVFQASKDQVWPLLVAEVGLNYPVSAIEKDSGLLTTDFVALPVGYNNMHMDRWVFPPRIFLATWNGLRMKMNIMVVEVESNRTQVTIRTHFEAYESNVTKGWIVSSTNGSVENAILTSIERQIR